jgi:thiamine phosphate synthase YjbQ (UPF0047 family)
MKLPFKKRKDMRRNLQQLTSDSFISQDDKNPWCRVADFAIKAKVTSVTVLNWIRSDKLEGGTFQGIIFVRAKKESEVKSE